MRIVSLVPSATETLYALDLGDSVVGVTHECDFPPEASELPHLTRTVIPEGLSAREIDEEVRERTSRGEALYELDSALLQELEPDLIVTQALCAVCAVSEDDVRAVAKEMPSEPEVLSLDPTTLGEVMADVRVLGMATDTTDEAEYLLEVAADRIDAVTDAVNGVERPLVAALEWLDPPFIGGHWVPQLVELAGGVDTLGHPGEKSRSVEWAEVYVSKPEVIVAMPCGYDTGRSADEVLDHREALARAGAKRVYAVDAAAYFSRPGPRLIDGLELLAHILHPERVDEPPPGRFARLDPAPVS